MLGGGSTREGWENKEGWRKREQSRGELLGCLKNNSRGLNVK